MKAIAVVPGKKHSAQVIEAPGPSIAEVPAGRGVRVKVLRVGVDGTDREINDAQYGRPPAGEPYLILGHENFGRVEAIGPNVTEIAPGDYVVSTVRRPGKSLFDAIGTQDMTTDDVYYERGINLLHGFSPSTTCGRGGPHGRGPQGARTSASSSSRSPSSRRASPRRTRSSAGSGCGAPGARRCSARAPSASWRRWCSGSAGSR
jgi:hypothetical protein